MNSDFFLTTKQLKNRDPLVGILAGKHKSKSFSGDRNYFLAIHNELKKRGGFAFVFTVDHTDEQTIDGYTFYDNNWRKFRFPYPNIVYNRLPTTKQENIKQTRLFFNRLIKLDIPYFNSSFFNKWQTYQLLAENKKLQPFLPEAICDKAMVKSFLKKHRFVYAKPTSGKTGDGIFVLKWHNNNSVTIQTHDQKDTLSEAKFNIFHSHLLAKKFDYLFQKGIKLKQHHGKPYDFRLLMQKPTNSWVLTGIGVRQAANDGITTHVPRGGSLLSIDDISPPVNGQILLRLGTMIAKTLEASFGNIKECSIDIGRDMDGHYWIFEVNSKPMSFDEQNIEAKRVKILVDTFMNQTRPHSENS